MLCHGVPFVGARMRCRVSGHQDEARAARVSCRCRIARNSGNVKANAVSAEPATYSQPNRMRSRRASTMMKTLPAMRDDQQVHGDR